jgi:hypothetical protein
MLQSTACEFDHTCDLESRINSISIMGIMQTDVTDAPPLSCCLHAQETLQAADPPS